MDNYSKNVKQNSGASNSAQKKTNDVEIHLEKSREIRKKALKISEFLTEGQLKPDTFLRCLKHITQEIYKGVVQERSTNKTCGYPLCNKVLSEPLRQTYYIDRIKGKIYDARKLKPFCSMICYRASNHIKNQFNINSSSGNSRSKEFNLLSTDEKASQVSKISANLTKPVQLNGTTLKSKEPQTNSLPKTEIEKVDVVPDTKDLVSKIDPVDSTKNVKEHIESTPPVKKSLFSQRRGNAKTTVKSRPSVREKVDPLKTIKDSFSEWVTIETYKFLYGEDKVVELINKERLTQHFKSLNLEKVSNDVKTKYRKVVHKLKLQELSDEKFDKRVVNPCLLKPLPNYKQLQRETENYKLKYQAWNEGKFYDTSIDEKPPAFDDRNQESQSSIQIKRRQIYMKSILPALKKLTNSLSLRTHDVREKLQLLLETFNLSAYNIMFEPIVGTVVSVILIQLLGIYDEELKTKLESMESKACIRETYELIPGAETQILKILDDLKDINVFLNNFLSSSEDTHQSTDNHQKSVII